MKRRQLQIGCCIMVAFFLMVIGLAGGAKQASAARKDTLIVGLGELPPTIDIERSTHPMSWLIVTNVGEQYLGFGRKPSDWDREIRILDYSKYDTRAVEKYELSPDSTKLTFHLRRGVKSPSGNELTTKDFYWTMKRGLAMGGTTAYKFANLSMSKNMEESVQIKNDYTITLVAQEPTALFLIRHSFPSQIIYDSTEAKKHATASDPWAADYISKNAPTFGPYYITKWTPGREALLEANPNYYKGVPYFKKVILKVIPESSSRLAMIRDGTIDVAYDLSPREIISLKDAKGVKPINVKGVWLNHLVLNDLVVPELKKKPVRQAVNYAINRKKIVEMAYYGMAEPMKFIFPSRFPGVLDLKEFPYDYDLKKAKEKLVEAGYPEGFETEIFYQAGILQHETACVIIKEDLGKIGIKARLRRVPIGALDTLVRQKKAPLSMWRESPFAPDTNYGGQLMYASSRDIGGYCNYSGYNNPELDRMLKEGKAIMDPKKRIEYHYDMQRLVLEDAPVGFVVQENIIQAIRSDIKGWNIDVGEGCRWSELSR